MRQPVRRAVRDRVRRPARGRRRGRRRAARLLGRRPAARSTATTPTEMCTVGPRPGADPVAEPARGRDATSSTGREHQLPLDEPDTHYAIHGLVRWAAWTVAEREAHRVVVEHVLHPQPGYPFALALRIEYALSDRRLRCATTATNVGVGRVPVRRRSASVPHAGPPTVDPSTLRVPAGRVLDVGRARHADRRDAGGRDAVRLPRARRPVGATRLDHCFTDLERDDDGLARVTLDDPERSRASRSGSTRPTAT